MSAFEDWWTAHRWTMLESTQAESVEIAFNAGLEAAAKAMEDIKWTDNATEGWKPDESFAPYYARAIRAMKES